MKEAQYYQIKYGGNIYRFSEMKFEEEELTQEQKDEGILVYETGDMDQLQPFGFQLNTVLDKKDYLNRLIDIMFPSQIILNTIKDYEQKKIKKWYTKLRKIFYR